MSDPNLLTEELRKLAELVQMQTELFAKYQLTDWKFELDSACRRAGCCFHHKKLITLSHHHVMNSPWEEVKNTLLHEVAHALAGGKAGHGPAWQWVCQQVGARPERCYNEVVQKVMPKGAWVAKCLGCGREYRRHRRMRVGYSAHCRPCGHVAGKLNYELEV